MQIEQCLVELHIPQCTALWPQMQALIDWLNWYFIARPPLKDVFRTISSGIL